MKKKTIIFCLIITLIFSVLSFIYYIPTFTDTTILVLGVVVMLNLFIAAELNKITQQPEKVQLWRVYFSVICSGLILVIKMIRVHGDSYWIAVGFMFFLIVILVSLTFLLKKKG